MIEHTFTPKSGQQYHVIEKRIQSLMGDREKLLAEDGSSNDSDPRDGYVRRDDSTAGPTSYSPRPGKSLTVDGKSVTYTSESALNGNPSMHQVRYDVEASTIASSFGYKGDSDKTGTSTSLTDPSALLEAKQTLLQEATEKYRAVVTQADNVVQLNLDFDIDSRVGHYARQGGTIHANFDANDLSYRALDGSITRELEVEGMGREFTPEASTIRETTHFHGTTSTVETSPSGTSSTYRVEDPAEFLYNFWSQR